MKALVVYDSTYGNTEIIARSIAGVLEARFPAQAVPVAVAGMSGLQAGDLLIVGCPTQVHTVTPALRTWLKGFQRDALQGVQAVAFDTRYRKADWLTGVASHKIARELRRAGATLLAPAESFFVSSAKPPMLEEGEIDRVMQWAEALARLFAPTRVEQKEKGVAQV